MKTKIILLAIIILVMTETLFTTTNDWVTAISSNNWTSAISLTSTNIILKNSSSENTFMVFNKNNGYYFPEYNEDYTININQITKIMSGDTEMGGTFVFTPVSFTNQLVGFRINHYVTLNTNRFWIDDYRSSTNTWYVALSDTPVEVGEEDVEGELDLSEPEEP